MQHHEDTAIAYTRQQSVRTDVLGVIVVGSVARGEERPDSDVDVYVVVTDEAYAVAAQEGRIAAVSHDGVTYDGGYVDIKLTSPGYLSAAVTEADDPTRASFVGARITLDRTGDLAATVAAITTLPDDVWERRVHAYRCQVALYAGYFLRQAFERGDDFLLRHSAVHAAFAAGRAALARQRRLFRGQKYLSRDLAALDGLPTSYATAWQAILDDPSPETAAALIAVCDELGPAPLSIDESLSQFITDNELAWLNGTIPPEFW